NPALDAAKFEKLRLRALYPYHATDDGGDDELSIETGDLIETRVVPLEKQAAVHSRGDGWMYGEILQESATDQGDGWQPSGRAGWFPKDYAETLGGPGSRGWTKTRALFGTAKYDYEPQHEDELRVSVGDRVRVVDGDTAESWWKVRKLGNGSSGAASSLGMLPAMYIDVDKKIAKDGTAAAATITPVRKRSTTATRKPAAAATAKPRHIAKPSASVPAAHPKTGEKYESRTYTLDDYVVSYTNSLARGASASAAAAASGGFQTAMSLATKQPATAHHKPTVTVEAAEAKTEVIVLDSSDEDMAAASASTSTKLSDAILPTAIGEGIRLDKMQHHIANLDIDKPLLIVAGAGSGKTTTLCARVIEMVRRGVMPASIL
ncbi:hypothetical protein IWW47_005015, partial [Coemansia sp. RSA 2052]